TCRGEPDGTFTVVVGSVDISGAHAALLLMAAETLGVAPARVRVVTAPSDVAPYSPAAGGSKIALVVGAAVVRAAEDARRQLFEIAADELEASPADLEIADPGLADARGATGPSPAEAARGPTVRVRGVPSRQ